MSNTKTASRSRKPEEHSLLNQEILDALTAHQWFAGNPILFPTGFYVSQNLTSLERAAKEFTEVDENTLKQFADREVEGAGEDARETDRPKKAANGQGYEVTKRLDEFVQARNELLAQTNKIRGHILSISDFDFLVQEKGDVPKEDRKNFLDTVPPWVWMKMGPLLKENNPAEE
jgi:hypothetical protein